MLIVGLTGSIGMGKSTVAGHFNTFGIPSLDADAAVHELYKGVAAPLIEDAFPGTTLNGVVDRKKLANVLVKNPSQFKTLEQIVHPLVRKAERTFLRTSAKQGAKVAILEIPLLFETGADKLVDVTLVASTTAENQKMRAFERDGMTSEKLETLNSRQLPDEQKRKRADFVVDTSGPIEMAIKQVERIIEELRSIQPRAYQSHWV